MKPIILLTTVIATAIPDSVQYRLVENNAGTLSRSVPFDVSSRAADDDCDKEEEDPSEE